MKDRNQSYTVHASALQASRKGLRILRMQSRSTKCLVCRLDLQMLQGKSSAYKTEVCVQEEGG